MGQGAEFDRRLAQRARMRAAILAEHRREHHRSDGGHGENGRHDENGGRHPGREAQYDG